MNGDSLKTSEAAETARVSTKTVIRWIRKGYRGKRLAAERAGLGYRINPNTFQNFLWKTGQASRQ